MGPTWDERVYFFYCVTTPTECKMGFYKMIIIIMK